MIVRAAATGVAAVVLASPLAACAHDEVPHPVTVAVVDTGVAVDAPFDGKLDVERSRSVVADGIDDVDGHGTEMAAVVHGAAPEADLVAVKVVGPDGTSDQRIAAGIDRALAAGADVVLLSMAGAEPLPRTRAAIRRAAEDDVLVVAAAGNDGLVLDDHPAYPAAYAEPNLVAVAAVDADGGLLGSSNRGSTVTAEGQGTAVPTCRLDGEAATTGATSAAAALVAGAAARHLRAGRSMHDVRRRIEASPAIATADPCR